jgi:CarD family transcriptional regulator
MLYEIGNYVVCPGHGVGQVNNIEVQEIAGTELTMYVVKIISNGMTVMVPSTKKDGIRGLVSQSEIDDVYELLEDHDVTVDNSTWNRRHRDYLAKVKTGALVEIADVLRSLFLLRTSKKLSFGERKMMDQCKELIIKEIAISTGGSENDISGKIDGYFN